MAIPPAHVQEGVGGSRYQQTSAVRNVRTPWVSADLIELNPPAFLIEWLSVVRRNDSVPRPECRARNIHNRFDDRLPRTLDGRATAHNLRRFRFRPTFLHHG